MPALVVFGGTAKAERGRRLVLPGVRPCSPVEEGIPHAWVGGLVVHTLGGGVAGAGSQKCGEVGSPLG